MSRPLFLDRDGVLTKDSVDYVRYADEIELLPGVGEALFRLAEAGFEFYVVSNQQGVPLGLISEDELPRMNRRIGELLEKYSVRIRHFEYCTALKTDGDPCRKPEPGMILKVRRRFGLDTTGAFMVGDRWSDIEAGARAGLRTVLVLSGVAKRGDEEAWEYGPEVICDDMTATTDYILHHSL